MRKLARTHLLAGIAVILTALILLFVILSSGALAAQASTASAQAFTDVPPGHPYATAISRLADTEIINGYGDGRFGPDAPVLRAQFAKMICGAFGLNVGGWGELQFVDVPWSEGTLYPAEYIREVAAYGITTGVTPTTFAPYRDISRAQVITMVVRAFNSLRPNHLNRLATGGFAPTWGDFDPTHGGNVAFAEANGLLAGLPLVSLNPWGSATRGEVARILSNVLDVLADPHGRMFEQTNMNEAELVEAIESGLSVSEDGSRPGIYLPEVLPRGYGLAVPGQPVVFGDYDYFSGAGNPFIGNPFLDGATSDYAVTYTNGTHNLVLVQGSYPCLDDPAPQPAGVDGRYGPLGVLYRGPGTVIVWVPGAELDPSALLWVLAYKEDLPAALALAQSVHQVAAPVIPWPDEILWQIWDHCEYPYPRTDVFLPDELPTGWTLEGEVGFPPTIYLNLAYSLTFAEGANHIRFDVNTHGNLQAGTARSGIVFDEYEWEEALLRNSELGATYYMRLYVRDRLDQENWFHVEIWADPGVQDEARTIAAAVRRY